MDGIYRKLSPHEIETLRAQGCVCEHWEKIDVCLHFDTSNIYRSEFRGDIMLGNCSGTLKDHLGVERKAGIRDSVLENCRVADGVLIETTGMIHGYHIEENVLIENTGRLCCTGAPSFGNGIVAKVVNEKGGREIPLYNELNAQIAYLLVMYRSRPKMVAVLEKMVEEYITGSACDHGIIGARSVISGCGTLHNLRTGEGTVIENAQQIVNSTVNSCLSAPSYIGAGVLLHDSIVSEGGAVKSGAVVSKCFIGQGSVLSKGFSANDSLFFANCEMECGEAVSVFAGPHSVSHHRSSLLIAGYFLFFNAGSGANQSNHLFKTGPVHQGIHERGVKFGSNSYVMLPAREGAFSLVIGSHTSHHDTSLFPFSYLTSENGSTWLHPGACLKSYGLKRDLEKWPHRDRRRTGRRDIINYEPYNPYIGSKLLEAVELCEHLLSRSSSETIVWQRIRIKRNLLEKGMTLYKTALAAAIGCLLENKDETVSQPPLRWVDAAGMYISHETMEQLCGNIETGAYKSLKEVEEAFRQIHNDYGVHSRRWALSALTHLLGRKPTDQDIIEAIGNGDKSHELLCRLRAEDAMRDFGQVMRVGYGIDAYENSTVENDFIAVRGKSDNI